MNNITKETRHESYLKVDKKKRYTEFISLLKCFPNGLTTREIMEIEHLERNQVAPRLTELVAMGKINVIGKRLDKVTHKNIAVYKVIEQDTVTNIQENKIDMGYKMKCENCNYAMVNRNDNNKLIGYFCKKLKGDITLANYKKISVCNYFIKR